MATRARDLGSTAALIREGQLREVRKGARATTVASRRPRELRTPLIQCEAVEEFDQETFLALLNGLYRRLAEQGHYVAQVDVGASHLGPGEGGASFYWALVTWEEEAPDGWPAGPIAGMPDGRKDQ